MKNYINPPLSIWDELCIRPSIEKEELASSVNSILNRVKTEGDKALFYLSKQFDNVDLDSLVVSKNEITYGINKVPTELKKAIQLAKSNIEKFHESQKENLNFIETTEGVVCWRKSIGIQKVGLYIPGGSAPLFSTILMLGVPAKIAGCQEVVLCTPAGKNGAINPAILYTASLVGITTIFKIGGAQAIGAMAYGTESVPQVFKIFGPGNQFVTKAKEMVQQDGVAIDMPAGPSEVLVIADETCEASFVAADLLSQAEHGADSQVMLVCTNAEKLAEINNQLIEQLKNLPRAEMASAALSNSKSILFSSVEMCIQFSNLYAPEHLIIASENAENYIDEIINAGSVFIGNNSCESAGDYASGTNHTLPTNGYAKNYSGVSLDSFVRKITFQKISDLGIQRIGPAIELMAEAEALFAHKNAVTIRLNRLKNV